jgi:hypothetical protein
MMEAFLLVVAVVFWIALLPIIAWMLWNVYSMVLEDVVTEYQWWRRRRR